MVSCVIVVIVFGWTDIWAVLLSEIWYYLQVLAIDLSSLSGGPLSTRTPKKHVLWPVQLLVIIADLD